MAQGVREICLCAPQSGAGLEKGGRRRHMAPAGAEFGVTGRRENERTRQQAGETMRRNASFYSAGQIDWGRRPDRGH